MRFPKLRTERRGSPSSVYYLVGGSALIAFLLILVWVYSAPAEIAESAATAAVEQFNQNDRTTSSSSKTSSLTTQEEEIGNDNNKGEHETVREEDDTQGDTEVLLPPEVRTEPEHHIPEQKTDKLPQEEKQEEFSTTQEEKTDKPAPEEEKGGESSTNQEENTKDSTESEKSDSQEEEQGSVAAQEGKESAAAGDDVVHEKWKLCAWNGSQDYIPCLDNTKAIKALRSTKHFEHRERHCPLQEELPKCLVPLPDGYTQPIRWNLSRDQIWMHNVPHMGLVSYKKDQNWVRQAGDKLLFPGGGTQFKTGAGHYIDFIQELVPSIAWGKHTRVVLDVGCGVASFGGYLFDKDVITMSFAPKDEHEAQVQLALERGIPAFSAAMGTQRLVFPSNVFDTIHCARCRVAWHGDGGILLVELNRVLRPGGVFIWSATPVYKTSDEDRQIWTDTVAITEKLCWSLLEKGKDPETGVGVAVFQKPTNNECYDLREVLEPPYCEEGDKPDAAWYVRMKACIHKIPIGEGSRSEWPVDWPLRVDTPPLLLSNSSKGIYGKPAVEDYEFDTDHWKHVIQKSYLEGVGVDWSTVRNVMDMKAGYGGFAAALIMQQLWVMNIVPVNEPDTLPIIFDRGLIGMYHNWCEPHSTYPRSYDLMHADHLFSTLKCNLENLVLEMDRILRPEGWAIFRDKVETLSTVQETLRSLHWEVRLSYEQQNEQLLVAQKTFWRPKTTS
ncbi:unnamed protein product [Sphagnum troendelagicum]|uniref:Methyltransferase n=1 Tax=Sphagnum troendelagicum TaxID=128251 RepID=A0ABP0U5E5_9BRYO